MTMRYDVPANDRASHNPSCRFRTGTTMSQSDPRYQPASLEAWTQAATKSAPGCDLGALNWTTPDGNVVKPLYTSQDVTGLSHADTLPGFAPYLRGPQATMYAARPWP